MTSCAHRAPGASGAGASSAVGGGSPPRCRRATASINFSCSSSSLSSLPWAVLAAAQSTSAPLATESARSSRRSSPGNRLWSERSFDMAHLVGEPQQRAADRFSRSLGRRPTGRGSDFFEAHAELDAGNQDLALVRLQPLQRRFVPVRRLAADGEIQRRRLVTLELIV